MNKISKIAECARKDECGFCGGPEYYGNLLAYAMETADDFNYFDDVDDSRYCSLKHLITECPTPPHPKSNSKVGFEFPNSNSDNQCGDGFARYVSGGWSCACRVGYPCVELGNSCTPNDRVWDPYMGPAGGNWENSGGDMGKPIKGKLNGYYNLRKNDPRTISAGKSLWKGWIHNQCGDAGGYGWPSGVHDHACISVDRINSDVGDLDIENADEVQYPYDPHLGFMNNYNNFNPTPLTLNHEDMSNTYNLHSLLL